MAHIHNGILLGHKKIEIDLFVVRWMDLEPVIQSEVRKRKTNTIFLLNLSARVLI